jgi:putative membrane protein
MKKLNIILLALVYACLLQACSNDENRRNEAGTLNLVADAEDAKFTVDADNFFRGEVELGRLAMQKGSDKRVRNFGAMMVKDYNKIDGKLISLVQKKKIKLPAAIDSVEQKGVDSLGKKSGRDFDNAYINYMIVEHKQAIVVFTDASKHRYDEDIKKFAHKYTNNLKRHLESIDAIKESMQ